MNRRVWIVTGIVVIALGIVNVILGMNLVPTIAVAQQRGTAPGWWLIWSVIALTMLCALALGGFLLAAGLGKLPETADR
jgi:hypothetical protein